MKKIRTIIFDLGGVLINYSIEATVRKFEQIGCMNAAEFINPYKQSGVLLQLERGEIRPEDFHDAIIREIGRPVDPQAIDDALCSFLLDLPQYKLDMLLDLRFMMEHRFKQQGLTIDAYFDRLFLSYRMKLVKPYPEIYRKMIDESGILPAESLFIDDSEANIRTAASLGFNTYLAAQHEDFRNLFSQYEPFTEK